MAFVKVNERIAYVLKNIRLEKTCIQGCGKELNEL